MLQGTKKSKRKSHLQNWIIKRKSKIKPIKIKLSNNVAKMTNNKQQVINAWSSRAKAKLIRFKTHRRFNRANASSNTIVK